MDYLPLWWRARRARILFFVLCALMLLFSFFLLRLPFAAVWYPLGLCAIVGALFLLVDYRNGKRKWKALLFVAESCAEDGLLPPVSTPEDAGYREVIQSLRQNADRRDEDWQNRYRDLAEYYTLWAHQVKTPIASMHLMLQSEDTPLARNLTGDVRRIEQYVDMVMTYLRLDADSSDYVFRTCAIDSLVRKAVKAFSTEFILRHLSLEFTPTGQTILTDEKWVGFVLEQLLSNALKYTPEGCIRIYSPGEKRLSIADTGMGIAPEDLPRVFEKSTTGIGGHMDRRSSGIGLYLCKRICDALSIGISITSVLGEGTTVSLDFSLPHLRGD